MISISRLLCDRAGPGDHLRYLDRDKVSGTGRQPPPIVVWNCTRQCNLRCRHCYAWTDGTETGARMSTTEAESFIEDLAAFGVPVILFSGGEPLLREDLFHLAAFARSKGLRVVLSTNGTLIDENAAARASEIGFAEVGISLDGTGTLHDQFRGVAGSFEQALRGIRLSKAAGNRVSLRFTITRGNYQAVPAILDLVEQEEVDRVCFYHLAYSGRGSALIDEDVDHYQRRQTVDYICRRTIDFHAKGLQKEVLTVGNHADGIYIYLKESKRDAAQGRRILGLLESNGGNNSGIRIAAVDDLGYVHPDQFWWHYSLGNVKERKFGDIWTDTGDPLLRGLKDRKGLLKGRCARCRYLHLCNGNSRVRAEAVHGDVWAEDPACYLSDEEIGSDV